MPRRPAPAWSVCARNGFRSVISRVAAWLAMYAASMSPRTIPGQREGPAATADVQERLAGEVLEREQIAQRLDGVRDPRLVERHLDEVLPVGAEAIAKLGSGHGVLGPRGSRNREGWGAGSRGHMGRRRRRSRRKASGARPGCPRL